MVKLEFLLKTFFLAFFILPVTSFFTFITFFTLFQSYSETPFNVFLIVFNKYYREMYWSYFLNLFILFTFSFYFSYILVSVYYQIKKSVEGIFNGKKGKEAKT